MHGIITVKDLFDLQTFLATYGYFPVKPKGEYEQARFHHMEHDPIIIFFRPKTYDYDDEMNSPLTVQKYDYPMIKAFLNWRKKNARLHSSV